MSIALDKTPKFTGVTTQKKQEILNIAFTSIILNLYDTVLCQVNSKTTAYELWTKLESLYVRKTLSNKIYLKKKSFSFKMDPIKPLETNLDDFKKITIELANIREEISEENQAVFLLNSLRHSMPLELQLGMVESICHLG